MKELCTWSVYVRETLLRSSAWPGLMPARLSNESVAIKGGIGVDAALDCLPRDISQFEILKESCASSVCIGGGTFS